MELKNKKIIVTGGAAGIGKELVKQLLKKGAIVSAIDINVDNLKLLKEELNNERLFTYKLDVSSEKDITLFKEEFINEQGSLDILINNAGIIHSFSHIENLDMDTINRVMNINFFAPLRLIKEFIPELKKRSIGHIVNVSSMGGFFPFPGQSVYGASKSALNLLTEGIYSEFLGSNIGVTLVLPGAIATDIVKNSNIEVKDNSNAKSTPMTPADKAAKEIITAIEKNKYKIYIGKDSKFMNILYKFNSKSAIKKVNKMMSKYV